MLANDSNLGNFSESDIDNLDHVGTRAKHLFDLYDLWSTGLDILERYDKESSTYAERKKELETGLKMLRFRMEKSYGEDFYRRTIDQN